MLKNCFLGCGAVGPIQYIVRVKRQLKHFNYI